MSPDAATANLAPELAEKLGQLKPGTYCTHRSWGFGQVKEWREDSNQIVIDFQQKAGHLMDFGFAAQSLTPLADDHILVQKTTNLEALRQQAKEAPVNVVRRCIESLGEGATADGIQKALSPDVVPADQWKKWWDGAKRALRKDGHFYLPTKKSEPLRVLDAPTAMGQKALEDFRAAVGYKNLIAALAAVQKFWADIRSDEVATEILVVLNGTLAKMPRTKPAHLIELALARDEFLAEAGRSPEAGSLSVDSLTPAEVEGIAKILDELSAVRQARLLQYLEKARPDTWAELFVRLMPRANGRVAETIVEAFVKAGRGPEIVDVANRLIRERNVTCDFLYWLCKNRDELFQPLLEPHLMVAILAVLERDQLSEIKRGTRLYELLLADKELVATLFKGAAFEDVRDITRAILLSPVFEELDERSLLAQIIKLYPEVQAMIVGEKSSAEDESVLVVSWESLEARRKELEDLVNVKIPDNSKDIGVARSYGDLRENAEFKAAKEMQTVLMRRKAELEQLLVRAQGTDFAHPDASAVNIGTRVTLRDTATDEVSTYSILGAWDSDPSKGVISYLTPVARALSKRTVGDTVVLPGEAGDKQVIIEKIEPYQP